MPSEKEPPTGLKKGQELDDLVHHEIRDEGEYKKTLKHAQLQLLNFQREMAESRRSLIIVFEGPDAAGKGGAIKRVVERLDPRLVRVHSIIKPTQEEYAHHYLWRFWNKLPQYGQCAVFDRSWYGRVLIERVEKFATEKEWHRAYQELNDFERLLCDDGTIVLKFYLHVSKEEQLARFHEREKDPYKHWKINEEDWRNRNKWKEHNAAAEVMFERTSTAWAPWHVIGGNLKWYARVKAVETIVKALEKVDFTSRA